MLPLQSYVHFQSRAMMTSTTASRRVPDVATLAKRTDGFQELQQVARPTEMRALVVSFR